MSWRDRVLPIINNPFMWVLLLISLMIGFSVQSCKNDAARYQHECQMLCERRDAEVLTAHWYMVTNEQNCVCINGTGDTTTFIGPTFYEVPSAREVPHD